MRMVNRSLFLVRPQRPYIDWAASLDEDAPEHVKMPSNRVSVYLAPEDPLGKSETPPIEDYFLEILDAELEAWSRDPDSWPTVRDFATFRRWFEVTGNSMVMDLGSSRLQVKEP